MATAYLKNRTPHKALKMETPFKMLHGEEADLLHLRVVGAKPFVHIKDSKISTPRPGKGEGAAIARRANLTKSGTQSLTALWREKRHHYRDTAVPASPAFKGLFVARSGPPSWDLDDTLDNDYISYDNLLRDVRDYTGVLGFTVNIAAYQEIASDVSADLQVQGLVDQIHDLTRKDLRTLAAPFPGAASSAEPLPGAVREPLSGGASPPSGGGASLKIEGLLPAPVPATARRGAPMRNNRVHRPNVATRRATAELTGAITRYRAVRSNNNNDDDNNINNSNHATLAEISSRVRCTSCDNWFSTPTRTRRILHISFMPRRMMLKSPTP